MMAQDNQGTLVEGGTLKRNLCSAAYQRTVKPLQERVLSMITFGDYIILGTAKYGCHIYKAGDSDISLWTRLGEQAKQEKRGNTLAHTGGSSCTDLTVSQHYLAYIKEYEGSISVCVHEWADIVDGKTKCLKSLTLQQRAPLVVEHDLSLIVIGGVAWKSSWTTNTADNSSQQENASVARERMVRVLGFNFELRREFIAATNSISKMHIQVTAGHSMLGVADVRTGLTVFDLRHPTHDGYQILYQVPVEEIRNFQLVGTFVAVFHKFEPNVTFWNMKEQKTILCINIQDQMRALVEENFEDEDDDSGLAEPEEDHVTSVTSTRFGQDHMLTYGTRSGCIFGMSVQSRRKVFSLPYPHDHDTCAMRRDVLGVAYLSGGRIVACFDGGGLTILDFSMQDPPDRPPTRANSRANSTRPDSKK